MATTSIASSLMRKTVYPEWVGHVTKKTLQADILAGLTGASLSLPQAVAFSAIAGLPPEYGFYTAIVVTVVAACAGSSWQSISGPATAISALIFGVLSPHFTPGSPAYISAAITLAFMVGVLQLMLGFGRIGGIVDFVSHSVMVGFISSAALLIGLSQLGPALGLTLPRPEAIVEFVSALPAQLAEVHLPVLAVSGTAFCLGLLIRLIRPTWPNYMIAFLCSTAVSVILGGPSAGIATIGEVSGVVPSFGIPSLAPQLLHSLASGAGAIALVGLIEAVSIARALAMRSGQMIDGNREFVGQGLSNLVGGLFHCYPGSASFTRSAVNYDAGAKTPVAAILSAFFLLATLYFVAPFFTYVPIAGIAGLILLVALRLFNIAEIGHILTTSKSETFILLVTFGSALIFDLETSIYLGVLTSLALFLNKTGRPFIGIGAPDPSTPNRMFRQASSSGLMECPQLMIARLDGPLYFGSVEFVRREFRRYETERPAQKHMIFIVKGVGEIDMPGADLLIEEAARRHRRGGSFHLQTKTPRTISKLARLKVMKALTKERIHLSKNDAINEAVAALDPLICATCTARIFRECPRAPDENAKNSSRKEEERS